MGDTSSYPFTVIARSEATKQSSSCLLLLDCFASLAMTLYLRRRRPRLLRPAQSLECLRDPQHADVVEAAADDLHADRKTFCVVAAVDRGRRILRHVPGHGVADVLERLFGIVDRGGQ